jgi:hypothetical protein
MTHTPRQITSLLITIARNRQLVPEAAARGE